MRWGFSHLTVAVAAATLACLLSQPGRPGAHPNDFARAEAADRPVAADTSRPRGASRAGQADDLSPEERGNVQVYQKVNRSVVNIDTQVVRQDETLLVPGTSRGSGSGSVVDKKGHVVTNFHVIEGARQISVTLHDGKSYEAELVGSDPSNDLAVLKIDAPAEKLVPIAWGDSAKLLVGMRVFAIGNPFGLERTLTTGIVSSLGRSLRAGNDRLIRDVIQTDAAINPGNSGGPLINRKGEMVGITTAIVGRSRQSSGIGLAIPANTARRVVNELIRHGRVIRPDAGILSVYQLDEGLLVARLRPDGPAEKSGLRGPEPVVVRRGGFVYRGLDRSKADLIVAVDGKRVRTLDDLLTRIEAKKPGDEVALSIIRDGKRTTVTVELEEPPQDDE